ncbi:MAG: DUF4124 domain-containing protein [Halioglobus sp.]
MFRIVTTMLLLHAAIGHAATVYKTVDDYGVVSFSDTPPSNLSSAEVIQIVPALSKSPEEYSAWLEQMRETTDRMIADRHEREQHRAKLKEASARTAAYQTPEPVAVTPQRSVYYPPYPLVTRPHWRRNHRPHPHPVAHPPLRSARYGTGSSNAQLMRPLVSPRR